MFLNYSLENLLSMKRFQILKILPLKNNEQQHKFTTKRIVIEQFFVQTTFKRNVFFIMRFKKDSP